MSYLIDQISFKLGAIFAFTEMVAYDVKQMAFSPPLSPSEYKRLAQDAKRITKEWGVKIMLEKRLLTTDLFPEEFTRGKWVLIIYKSPEVLKIYLGLKSKKEQLLEKDSYKGKERKAIAIRLGRLLSYRMDIIKAKLKKAGK
jgi:hypothetical protein